MAAIKVFTVKNERYNNDGNFGVLRIMKAWNVYLYNKLIDTVFFWII